MDIVVVVVTIIKNFKNYQVSKLREDRELHLETMNIDHSFEEFFPRMKDINSQRERDCILRQEK